MGLVKRRVPTKSGATAVQVARYARGERRIIKHLGSAHDPASLALLEARADELITQILGAEQLALELEGLNEAEQEARFSAGSAAGARTVGTSSGPLWHLLAGVYDQIFGTVIDSAVFRQLVIARIIEPTSKADSLRVIGQAGVECPPSLRTLWRHLARHEEEGWRDAACQAAYRLAAGDSGVLAVVLYDVTTLYFETDEEDETRKVGYSKERKVDPQIVLGLLVDRYGFPVEIHCFEGNKAETNTIIPVLDSFRARHQVTDMLVVADAGMLSYDNLLALEEAGYQYIVGTKNSKAPYDMAEVFTTGNNFTDGQIFETTTVLNKKKPDSVRRAVWQYRFARYQRDKRNQTKQIHRAEDIASGRKQQRRAKFLTGGGPKTLGVDYQKAEAERFYFGLKGYVTSTSEKILTGAEVIAAYHSLFEVEASFRMAKSDLRARPIFHHTRESIEAHLTMVFCALAVSRRMQQATGLSLKRILNTLGPLREAIVEINGQRHTIPAALSTEAQQIYAQLGLD